MREPPETVKTEKECTCDTCPTHAWRVRDMKRLERTVTSLSQDITRLGGDNALLRARLDVAGIEARYAQAPLQRKVNRQRLVIAKLQEDIKALKEVKHVTEFHFSGPTADPT